MPRPTVSEFRAVRLCTDVFAGTDDAIISDAIDEAWDEYRFRASPRSCAYAAAHLIAHDDDDLMQMDGVAANAVDHGTGGGIVRDEMDGDRRVIQGQGAGVLPGVVDGSQWDVHWYTTVFGRRAIEIERRRSAIVPMVVV